ncbi:MAG: hypothetical protein NXH72_12520 [Hyphomonadaceae bacterium]|nr:hypothetical protein [Hyphomonadaceae bacterium]
MSSITLDKPTHSTWLKPVERETSKPKKLWELHIVIPSDESKVFGRATLNTVPESGLFSERVKMTIWTTSTSPGDYGIETDVDGERSPDMIEMTVHIFGSSLRLNPMACHGQGSVDGTRYEGDWTMGCLKPGDCDCEGLTGTFYLSAL